MGAADDIKKGLTKNLATSPSSGKPKRSTVSAGAGGCRA